ncbi:MAG: hypothetical protein KIS96_13930 [Bauldia sp.]|nr:hypothetical protein [Bauldia sp.]
MRWASAAAVFLAIGAGALAPAPVAAQDIQLISITGDCERLVVRGFDFSLDCEGLLLQMNTMDGARTGFTVRLRNGSSIAFMGTHGLKPDADSQFQDVDSVIFQFSADSNANTIEATGLCGYSNPYLGPQIYTCLATSDDGEAYMLIFRTDGSDPLIEDGLAGGMPPPDQKRPNR